MALNDHNAHNLHLLQIIFVLAVPDDADAEGIDCTIHSLLMADFEMGQYFRQKVIPRAVLLFTGEAIDDEDYDSDCEYRFHNQMGTT